MTEWNVVSVRLLLLIFLKEVCGESTHYDSVDLCERNNSHLPYNEYDSLKTSLCDCSTQQCLRKCCRPGYYHNFTRDDNRDARCIRNTSVSVSHFSVTVFEGTKEHSVTHVFIVGMLRCNNTNMIPQYFKMDNSDPNEKYYLQTNGTLYFPKSKYKFYSNDRFCVDEDDGLTIYLCYTDVGYDNDGIINILGNVTLFSRL